MTQANNEIRQAIQAAGLRQWEVARAMGIHPVTLTQKLQVELSVIDRARVTDAINTVKKAKYQEMAEHLQKANEEAKK